jgi:hypothetical protein
VNWVRIAEIVIGILIADLIIRTLCACMGSRREFPLELPSMTANQDLNRIGAGVPDTVIVATLTERDPRCICTWIVHEWKPQGQSTFRLKYRDMCCPVRRHYPGGR